MSYSDKVIEHYNNPRNVGSFDPTENSVGTGLVGAPIKLQIKECKCGCGTKLRKDNKTGYQKGHKACLVCGNKTKGQSECCSKSCSAKLHWQKHPEMKETRCWNEARQLTREQNKDRWKKNISKSRQQFIANGGEPWNKGMKGMQVAWNKGLPSDEQPFFGYKHKPENIEKQKETCLKRYGYENMGFLAKNTPVSNIELKYGELFLEGYENNKRVGKFKVDYLNESKKHIVEIYGDYWHCHPEMFNEDDTHPQMNISAKEKWNKDLSRQQYLENKGYTVDIVWEREAKSVIND